MSTAEKFFENGARPIDVEHDSFLNDSAKQETEQSASPLPTPASCPAPKPKLKLSTAFIIPIWIVLSSTVIIYNNYLYNTLNFKFPVFLVTFHLGFAVHSSCRVLLLSVVLTSLASQAIGTRILQRTTHLLDGAKDVHLTKDMFVRSILPIGLLFSASLILSNTAYLYLSVAYIQMLKACFFFPPSDTPLFLF